MILCWCYCNLFYDKKLIFILNHVCAYIHIKTYSVVSAELYEPSIPGLSTLNAINIIRIQYS